MRKTIFNKKAAARTIQLSSEEGATDATSTPGYGQLPIDILESKNEIMIVAPLAGVDIDNTEVVINEDLLTIRGKREPGSEINRFNGKEYFLQECFWGEFSRSVILPPNVDMHNIDASQENHILYIRVPKKPNIQMRIVKIKSK